MKKMYKPSINEWTMIVIFVVIALKGTKFIYNIR